MLAGHKRRGWGRPHTRANGATCRLAVLPARDGHTLAVSKSKLWPGCWRLTACLALTSWPCKGCRNQSRCKSHAGGRHLRQRHGWRPRCAASAAAGARRPGPAAAMGEGMDLVWWCTNAARALCMGRNLVRASRPRCSGADGSWAVRVGRAAALHACQHRLPLGLTHNKDSQ